MNYVETVADLLIKCRSNKILTPEEYVAMAEWEKEEIPLEVVICSINQYFEVATTDSERTENLISVLQTNIKKKYFQWLQGLK